MLHEILRNTERLIQMSGTLADQLQTALNNIQADADAASTEVTALLAAMTPGATITQAMVDQATSIDARLKAIPPAPAP